MKPPPALDNAQDNLPVTLMPVSTVWFVVLWPLCVWICFSREKVLFNEFVSALNAGSSSPCPSPGQSHSAVFLGETHYSYSTPPVWE